MNRAILVCGVGVTFAVGALTFGQLRDPGCAGCAAPPGQCPPVLVSPHLVTNDQCAVLELALDGGITKTVCLTASQLEKVIDQ